MDQLRESILKTIRYGRYFRSEYGNEEIKERLISEKIYSDDEIEAKLGAMKLPKVKKTNSEILVNKVSQAKKLGELLAERFPAILLAGITGSVAAGYPKANEDIDLMIITKKDSLWIIRLGVKIWTRMNKIPHRKYGKKQRKDDFCFNLWLEEESLKLPVNRQNLKNAMDLILMKPVVNKNKIYEKFIRENEWVKKYVANGYNKINPSALWASPLDRGAKTYFSLGSVINWVAFWLQYWYMRKKLTGETVDLKRAFFHPKNR